MPCLKCARSKGVASALGLSIAGLLFSLAGCGERGSVQNSRSPTQVAARVNDREITISQLNAELARPGTSRDPNTLLRSLVEKELLVQRAMRERMDRDPEVLQRLQSARDSVMAEAWISRLSAAVAPPSDQEVKAYFAANPQFFNLRRVFSYRSLVATAPPAVVATIQGSLAELPGGLSALESRLRAQGIPFVTNVYSKTTEQFPPAVGTAFVSLAAGELTSFAFGEGVEIVELISSHPAPIDEAEARPFIDRFLYDQKKRAVVTRELQSLSESAKIEFFGEFAEAGQTSAAPSVGQTP